MNYKNKIIYAAIAVLSMGAAQNASADASVAGFPVSVYGTDSRCPNPNEYYYITRYDVCTKTIRNSTSGRISESRIVIHRGGVDFRELLRLATASGHICKEVVSCTPQLPGGSSHIGGGIGGF